MLSVIPTESILGSHSVWALPSLPWNSPCPPHWSLCLWPCPYNLCISQKTKYLLKLNSAHIPPPVKPMPPHLTRSHITTPPLVLPLPSSLTLSPKPAPAAPRTHPVTLHQAFCLCYSHCLESSVLRGLAASVRHSCLRANVTFSEPPSLATLSDVAFPHSCSALGTYCRTLCSCL